MNRILVGRSNNEIGIIKDNEVIINITKDTNVLIENGVFENCIFNVDDACLNVLVINENRDESCYEINVNKGHVSFNNVSYNSKDAKININLNKEESSVLVYNSVVAKDKIKYDIKVNHNKKNTNSDIYNNGITKENGSICFNVSSYAPRNSKCCKINQDSKIISLNETNDNEINPILLIDEFETEARHAAFIGNFKEEELFYLMSRGLNIEEARNLLISGLLIGTLNVCFNEKENLNKKLNEEWR